MLVKRIMACLLIAFMLLPAFVSCDDGDLDTEKPSDSEESSDDSDSESKDSESESKDSDKSDGNKNDQKEDSDTQKEPAWKQDNTLKILMIGNSFSQDTMQHMAGIAKSMGISDVKLCNLYIGGCSLDTHAGNAKNNAAAYDYEDYSSGKMIKTQNYRMKDALESENWDFVSLQQVSGSSGKADTYGELEYMISYVKSFAPKATLVWNMTWAYQKDSTHSPFANYNKDQMTMYESIVSTVKDKILTNDDVSIIVPNGSAIQNARTSYVGDKLTRDGYHLSLDFGRYIAGLTFLHAVTGISIENVSYMPSGVDSELQKVAIESVMNAIAMPYNVVISSYRNLPQIDETLYKRLDMEWTALGYYNTAAAGEPKTIVKNADNSKQFYASKIFTKEELPVGSVIVLADGWKYRPEGWARNGEARPDEVSIGYIVINDGWWGGYTERAFNLSKLGGPSLEGISQSEIDNAFIIYVPKN